MIEATKDLASLVLPSSSDKESGKDVDEANTDHFLEQLQEQGIPNSEPERDSPEDREQGGYKELNDDEDEEALKLQQNIPSYKKKLVIQSDDSRSMLLFDSTDSRLPPEKGYHVSNTKDSAKKVSLEKTPSKMAENETSVTSRVGLTDAVMQNMDFEILPDDEEDDDEEEAGDDRVADDDEENINEDDDYSEEEQVSILHRVEENSLDEDAEKDALGLIETDRTLGSPPYNLEIETSKSLSFDSAVANEMVSYENRSSPSSPSAIKRSSGLDDNGKASVSPNSSHNRRRISDFFAAAASPRRHASASKGSRNENAADDPIITSHSNDMIESTSNDDKVVKRGQRLTTLIRTTMGAIKDGIKSESSSVAVTTMEVEGEHGAIIPAIEDQDSSSDESSYDEDEHWLEDEPQFFDDDIDQVVDCSTFPTLPNSFLDLPPDIYDYLDLDFVKHIKDQDISKFAWEHHLLVKGLLQLLAERDLIGVEDDVHDSTNISKMGVLRKKHAKSGWRVKYVEVRKGNLTYFADKMNEKRRTLHLRKRTCSCRGQDLTFELIVDGGKRLLWMAKSEKECQGWIRAINQAIIGDTDDSRDAPLDLSVYQGAIDDFLSVQASMKDATTRREYLVAMNSLLYRQSSSSALRVPMKWIRETVVLNDDKLNDTLNDIPSDLVKVTIRDFWESLCNASIVLNGYLVEANSTYSGERVIGALSRCILEFDKVENEDGFEQVFNRLKRANQDTESFITEVEAVSYARSILSGALQSVTRQDVKAAVEKLFNSANVAHVVQESSEPLHIDVSFAGDDFSEDAPRTSDFVGWIETKLQKSKQWKMRYFVASEGVLSYFERANPRPYRLRGQIVLRDAKVSQLEGNILSIEVNSKQRLLQFEDRSDLLKWKAIFDRDNETGDAFIGDWETAGDVPLNTDSNYQELDASHLQDSASPSTTNRRRARTGYIEDIRPGSLKAVRGAGAKIFSYAADGMGRAKAHANRAAAEGMKRARSATDAGMKSIRTGAGMFIRGVGRRRPTTDMLLTSTRNLTAKCEKREPTVQAVVEMNCVFKVISQSGPDEELGLHDLLIVRVKLYQAFLLSGGPYGRLACGDELLLMEFAKADGVEDVKIEALEPPATF